MTRRPTPFAGLLITGLVLSLGACTRDRTAYPSLAERAVEHRGFAEPDAPAPAAIQADPALDAQIATFETQLASLKKGFDADAAKADAATRRARGSAVGSDAWLDAQSALAGLDDRRAQTSALVGLIEDLAIARAGALAPDYPPLVTLDAAAQAEAGRQGTTIDGLTAALPAA